MTSTTAKAVPPPTPQRAVLTTAEGRALALLFTLPGGLAGLALWLALELPLFETDRSHAACAALLVYGTGAWALTTEPGQRRRAAAFAGGLGLTLAVLVWLAWDRFGEESAVQVILAPPALGWVALAFFRAGFRVGPRGYPALFAAAWNLPVVLAVACAFAGGAYGLLWLLAAMFDLIGLPVLTLALRESVVSMPVIGALTASGIAVVRRQESVLASSRSVLLGLLRVLAPVFALGTALFSLALVFQGLDTLWEGWSPVLLLVATLSAGAVFVNAIVQEGSPPDGALGVVARLQALVLPVLAVLAVYGMGVRIAEHGLTPARIVASLVAAFAAGYAVTYAAAGASNRWAVLRRANVWLALGLAASTALTMTPLFRAQEWSVANQLSRLERGAETPASFDYAALRFEMGEPGARALKRLAEGRGAVAERAAAALAAENPYEVRDEQARELAAETLSAATIRPDGAALPLALRAALTDRIARDARGAGRVVLLMPRYDGRRDAALAVARDRDGRRVALELWMEAAPDAPAGSGAWALADRSSRAFRTEAEMEAFLEAVHTGPFAPATVEIVVPSIGGEPLMPTGPGTLVLPRRE